MGVDQRYVGRTKCDEGIQMIQINQLKVSADKEQSNLKPIIAKYLGISQEEILDYRLLKRSIDARKKPEIFYIYSVAVDLGKKESFVLNKKKKDNQIFVYHEKKYQLPKSGERLLKNRPVIIGMGPAGLFCAYLLALLGYQPIVLERGTDVLTRTRDVNAFWKKEVLNPNSNVQFGEGGAGTFSDGKLNTLVKDKWGRNRFVLETFVLFGAPESILWEAKPHIGTDILVQVIKNMRIELLRLGAEIYFQSQVTDFIFENDQLIGLKVKEKTIDTQIAVLAVGHSARDTFQTLHERDVMMSAKEFAVGLRVEHPQEKINLVQYGDEFKNNLSPSPYKLATKLKNRRGVYSFCMCPGGYVVNASSAEQQLVVNGMSYAARDSKNANSAIVVSVGKNEYDMSDPLAGISYQIQLEKRAYQCGNGKIPQQLFGDFAADRCSDGYGSFPSVCCGKSTFSNLNSIFSKEIRDSFLQGMDLFSRKIKNFNAYDTILSGVESRTSSPIRIERNEMLESNKRGLYPCGEGAGYAGGIMSAAMDGMKVAEEIIKKYRMNYG